MDTYEPEDQRVFREAHAKAPNIIDVVTKLNTQTCLFIRGHSWSLRGASSRGDAEAIVTN